MKKKISNVQDFIPIKNLKNGIIETSDGRFLKILEIEPINFMLRSTDEQAEIIYSFASWLKIAPVKLQFKSITKRADCRKHIENLTNEILLEESNVCKDLGYNYISLVKEVGNNQALTRRFFLIFEYEGAQRNDISAVCCALRTAEQNARNYFGQCGNSIIQPNDEDEATAEILYTFFNRKTAIDQSFTVRVEDTIMRVMKEKSLTFGVDEVPDIPIVEFVQPDEIDLTHPNYVVMDGTYYSFLYINGDGYPQAVRANWMSNFINAGEGIDVDVFLNKVNREKAIDKVAQKIRLNRSKFKNMQDTSTDYEEISGSIQAGYYIKNGMANNEDLYYLTMFITVSGGSLEELNWRKQQIMVLLKSQDIYVSECRYQQEDALRSVMPFLRVEPFLDKKAKRNVLTAGAASTYMFTSYEMSDEAGVMLGVNRFNNSLCILDLFNSKKYKNPTTHRVLFSFVIRQQCAHSRDRMGVFIYLRVLPPNICFREALASRLYIKNYKGAKEMDLFLNATTNVPDLIIDFIEVRLKSGKTVSLNWGRSSVTRFESNPSAGFDAEYLELFFDEELAQGRLEDLKDLSVTSVGLYSETCSVADICITEMIFTEGEETLTVEDAYSAEGVCADG